MILANRLRTEPLPHLADPSHWLERVRDLGMSVWLDSGRPAGSGGRFDIITAAPVDTLTLWPGDTDDAFARLQAALDARFAPTPPDPDLPFCGGAIGLFGYDAPGLARRPAPAGTAAASRSSAFPAAASHSAAFPGAVFGLYTWAVICDHQRQRTCLVWRPETPTAVVAQIRQRLRESNAVGATPAFQRLGPWHSSPDEAGYRAAFDRIQRYIAAGDCYQVNLARYWESTFQGDPWHAYRALRRRAAAPFSCWFETPWGCVMSLSPERFVRAVGDELLTQPIKGTAARDPDPQTDRALGAALLASAKNHAENIMIVDLLRNDFGRSCRPGSIEVRGLCELESYATVHHLVSTVRGRLRAGLRPLDALRACFPGGSITGAPKRRAMEIIAELEPVERSVFCGAIGYWSACGTMDTNIAIRTLLASEGKLRAWAGGGIVADSDCDEEFAESSSKIAPLLAELEGILKD